MRRAAAHPTSFQPALALLLVGCIATFLMACHSTGVNVTVRNNSSEEIRNLEVDYPGGSFGTSSVAGKGSYNYRIKPLGPGEVVVIFDLAGGAKFRQKGPALSRGEDDNLLITLDSNRGGTWQMSAEKR
jgi:hypothetical protein